MVNCLQKLQNSLFLYSLLFLHSLYFILSNKVITKQEFQKSLTALVSYHVSSVPRWSLAHPEKSNEYITMIIYTNRGLFHVTFSNVIYF